jgi:phosphohistidine phosphatase SixA
MFLYIARHAWAYEFGDLRWPDDSLRELDPEGAERYMRVVQALAERGFAPEVVATSPYTRCQQTAEIIAKHTSAQPEITNLEALEPHSDLAALIEWSRKSGCKEICWVGHAPDVGLMTSALIGDAHANIRFAKGAIAAIRFDEQLDHAAGQLYWHATAKSLGL